MRIRPINSDEFDVFTEAYENPKKNEEFASDLSQKWSAGESRPSWCFVVEQEGVWGGRMVFKADGEVTDEEAVRIDYCVLPTQGNYLDIGIPLIQQSAKHLKTSGIERMTSCIDAQFDGTMSRLGPHDEAYVHLVEAVRMKHLGSTTNIYNRMEPNPGPMISDRLTFCSMIEVGERSYIDAIARVGKGSLEKGLGDLIQKMGIEAWAQYVFNRMGQKAYEPEWWQQAFNAQGELVGFISPALWENSSKGDLRERHDALQWRSPGTTWKRICQRSPG